MSTQYPDHVLPSGELTEEGERAVVHGLAVLGEAARLNSLAHGFDLDRPFSEDIALIHSEASEALEEDRSGRKPGEIWYSKKVDYNGEKVQVETGRPTEYDGTLNKPEGIGPELADIIIRVMQSGDHRGARVPQATILKHRYNVSRPYRHGKQY